MNPPKTTPTSSTLAASSVPTSAAISFNDTWTDANAAAQLPARASENSVNAASDFARQ
jgi:hypothetical protein